MAPRQRKTDTPDGAKDDQTITAWVDGQSYVLRWGELTHRQELALYRQADLLLVDIFKALNGNRMAPFLTAAVVWLARIQAGDTVTYDQVASAIGYNSEFGRPADADAEDEPAPDPAPEAPGVD